MDQRRPRPHLPADLRAQLDAVEPSIDGGLAYRPCQVTLRDGSVRDHVYVQEAQSWFSIWGVDPEDDEFKTLVPIDSVVAIESSPTRLPVRIANALYEAGESAMGGSYFALTLQDGRVVFCESGNAIDFVDWPVGASPDDVVSVTPHAGRERPDRIGTPDYAWCLYED